MLEPLQIIHMMQVPNTGQHPTAENEALLYLCTGPICRFASDLYPMLQIMAGPDNMDSKVQ